MLKEKKPTKFGKELRKLCIDSDRSFEFLARTAGVTVLELEDIEHGAPVPPSVISNLVQWCESDHTWGVSEYARTLRMTGYMQIPSVTINTNGIPESVRAAIRFSELLKSGGHDFAAKFLNEYKEPT